MRTAFGFLLRLLRTSAILRPCTALRASMFTKILIANRGEIACRVIKTGRRWASRRWPFTPTPTAMRATSSWPTRPCASARRPSRSPICWSTRSSPRASRPAREAVHPGYGFLSENAEFARRLEEEGIAFIGPKHDSIAAMGDKIASKKLAEKRRSTPFRANEADRHRRARGPDRQRDRLSGDDQGLRRRRRQGPARRLQRQGSPRGLRLVPQRGARDASATTASSSRSTSRIRATSRSRCWATATAISST